MPTLAQVMARDPSRYEPVPDPAHKMDNGTNLGSYSLAQPQYPNTNNQYLRATVPQIGNASADSQRVFFSNGFLPQTRVPILSQLGTPFS